MATERTAPPIVKSPGDLMMIFNTALNHLKVIRNEDPNNFERVKAVANTTKIALDVWITLDE